jgi:3-methyladenine DNA glycosylase/8-oxoguanine DNA glycosylase
LADSDVDLVVTHVEQTIAKPWPEWRGGWPGKIEAALIDAVLSIRARYGSETTGVRAAVRRWSDANTDRPSLDDLGALAVTEPEVLASVLDNRQVLSGGASKPDAIKAAAAALVSAGVRHARDVDPSDAAHRAAYTGVKGLGPVTWEYFLMLLGHPGVKADTWIRRFVADAIGREPQASGAGSLVKAAAAALSVKPTDLDHAIWRHMSDTTDLDANRAHDLLS